MRTCEGYCRHVPAEVALKAVQEDPGHVADPAHHAHAVEAGRHHNPAPDATNASLISIPGGWGHGGFICIVNVISVIITILILDTDIIRS